MITYEEFNNFDLRIGEIKSIEKVDDKTFKVNVDCNGLHIAVLHGGFREKDLIGQKVAVVANVKPKEIAGITTQCIILAITDDKGGPILLQPDKKIKAGAKIK